jgi:translocation and assembly module TamA
VDIDSGPVFHFGDLQLNGLRRYKPWLVDRYHPPEKGDIYNRAKLLKFQRELQNSPYFSSVTVNVDPDPAVAEAVPVEVLITERQEYDVGLGAGYSTNTGARGEVSFQDRDFLNDAYDLKSVIRIEQLQQIGYVDMYLPPQMDGYLDSVGVLVNRSDISGLVTTTSSFGAKRVITENDIERRLGLSYTYEESTVAGGPEMLAKALVSSIGWTRRKVDSAFAPRKGYIAQLDIGAAAKAVLSDQNFIRLYGKIQYWTPVGSRDVLILRAESGYVIAPSSDGIPEDYLFRAGGTASVRGYSYQSLGVNQNDGVVGGRALATGTVEYVHWVGESWGLAAFVDEGDAADNFKVLRLEQGVGGGVRIKTPAGPIAIDLGYGREVQKFRLDFSVGIAF